MLVLTDSESLAHQLFPGASFQPGPAPTVLREVVGRLVLPGRPLLQAAVPDVASDGFDAVVAVAHAPRSQFDVLVELCREGVDVPPIALLADQGDGFHGHQGRSWAASAGNLHVSIVLRPGRPLPHAGAAYMALPAVAAAETIAAELPAAGAALRIKWVNDVLLGGAKVAGVLTHMASAGARIEHVVLGIGLNVEVAPDVPPDDFVPAVTATQQADPTVGRDRLLRRLLERLGARAAEILDDGPDALLDAYRRFALFPGEAVEVRRGDEVIARGSVEALGPDLELRLQGRDAPVTTGRLVLL